MSQSNISKTDPDQVDDLDEEKISNSTDTNSSAIDETHNSNESPWSTQGYALGGGIPSSSPPRHPRIAMVLPRRLENGGMFNQLFEAMWNNDNVQEFFETEEHLQSDPDEADSDPEEVVVIGRNHPDSSEAALAGYRYRIQ
ncbi:hypothetical protein KR038_002744 [Drosophila bunnanda]|nr:hypothetical protein KR038_002744 [Drosophila bunnanda]